MDTFEKQFTSIFEKVESKISAHTLQIKNEDLRGVPVSVASTVLCSAMTSATARVYMSLIYSRRIDLETTVEIAKKALENGIREYAKAVGGIPNDNNMAAQQSTEVHTEPAQKVADEKRGCEAGSVTPEPTDDKNRECGPVECLHDEKQDN